jgi:uncharacterized protein YbcC (UPF0753/DUF2309 family)
MIGEMDTAGKALEGIMQGPMDTQWINSTSGPSTVDNAVLVGSKTPHILANLALQEVTAAI